MANKNGKPTLLVDADILVYRIASSIERVICWDEDSDVWTLHSEVGEGKVRLDANVDELIKRLGAGDVIMAFSSRNSFRRDLFPQYKANRRGVRKPIAFRPLRDYVFSTYPSLEWDRLEADDILGVLSRSRSITKPKIVVSDDKDLRGVGCNLYRPSRPGEGVTKITPKEARLWHYTQTLMGDTTDGFPGLPGCGPVRAGKYLKKGTWGEVVSAYKDKGQTEEDALLQARMAKILSPKMYNRRTKKIKLWEPGVD